VAAGLSLREIGAGETRLAYPAMLELRANIGSVEVFVERVDELLRHQGYRLAGSFEEGMDDAAAVAGFRTGHDLVHGSYLYVDDLSTREQFRGRGHGVALMDWLAGEARRLGCDYLTLDSGVVRYDAHRFYLNRGMQISSHHFSKSLG